MSEEIENALKCLEMDMLDNTQIELLLNYIDKLQKENDTLKTTINKQSKDISEQLQELEKKDKVIDLMAEHISKYGKVCTFNYGATRPEQWIEYFYKKAEE